MAGSFKLLVRQCDLIFYCYVRWIIKGRKKTNEVKQCLVQILQLIHWNYANEIMLSIAHMFLLDKSMSSWSRCSEWLILSCSKTYDNGSGYVVSYSQWSTKWCWALHKRAVQLQSFLSNKQQSQQTNVNVIVSVSEANFRAKWSVKVKLHHNFVKFLCFLFSTQNSSTDWDLLPTMGNPKK